MTLVSHIEGYRRIWQFPRNIRRIYPWKMSQILLFITTMGIDEWGSNQNAQNAFCKALEKQGLKRSGFQRDAQSGGPRTYLAQLKSMGLLFKASDGRLYPTLAGEDLIAGTAGLEIMQKMLLRHQYPSTYSQGNNVKINPTLRIKPFMFVLQVLDQVLSLGLEEIAVLIIYGHNHGCLEFCVNKINQLRAGNSLLGVIDNPEQDLYLPRSENSSLSRRLENILDIANTCKNYMDSCFLVNTIRGSDGRQRILFNEGIRSMYDAELGRLQKFIPVHSEEQFQRRYGSWDRQKDTRQLLTGTPEIEAHKFSSNIILAEFFALCGKEMLTDAPGYFVDNLHEKWGFERQIIFETVSPYIDKALDKFSTTFLELARGGGKTALAFEKSLCNLLHDKFYFTTTHTGQRKRPSGKGGYADALVVALDGNHCGLIDAKASPGYRLSHGDYNAMLHTYIPNYTELIPAAPKLEFCLYVAYGFAGDIGSDLKKMSHEAENLPVSAISAKDLLDLSKNMHTPDQQEAVREGFRKMGLLSRTDVNL